MNGSLLSDAFGHHVWATLQIIDACTGLTEDQLATTVPGTYGTIIDTVRHTVGADVSYLALLSGGAVADIDEASLDLPALRAAMEATGQVWSNLLAQDLDPAAMIVRYRDDGSESGAPLGIRLAQVIHHGTDHRSQVCTALTSLGVEPPEIDVWAYAWKDNRLTETPPTT
jgi:uncharacterized damage-inducible protein DinB